MSELGNSQDPPFRGSTDLLYVNNEEKLYLYRNGVYLPVEEERWLKPNIYRYLTQKKLDPDSGLSPSLNITAALIDSLTRELKFTIRATNSTPTSESRYIALTDNQSLDTQTWKTAPSSRQQPAFFRLDITSTDLTRPGNPTNFIKFLGEVLVLPDGKTTDLALLLFVQEMLGYCLLDTTEAHATFFLVGQGMNGKSKLLDVLEACVGTEYVTNRTLEDLTTNRFATSALVGKKLNIANEEESKRMRSDLFKNLVSGESISAELKFGASFSFKPRVRFLFSTNQMPTFDKIDFALRRRLFILKFNRRIKESEKDSKLLSKLLLEKKEIIVWALEGAERLIQRGYSFVRAPSMELALDELEKEQSSVIDFFTENFVFSSNPLDFIPRTNLYEMYTAWCPLYGRQAKSRKHFFHELEGKYGYDHRASFSDEPMWDKSVSKSVRVVKFLAQTSDPSSWINNRR